MPSFWDTSWQQLSPERLTAYLGSVAPGPDPILTALQEHNSKTVCDAGCGCGIYSRTLAANGFSVFGFDVSSRATQIAADVLAAAGFSGNFRTASVCATGYESDVFDAVLCRDVLDHIPKAQAALAIRELLRITVPGGLVIVTTDGLDEEYLSQPHQCNSDGDYCYTHGKWEGMVFHPYRQEDFLSLLPPGTLCQIQEDQGSLWILIEKPFPNQKTPV